MSRKEGSCEARLELDLVGYKTSHEASLDAQRATAILLAPVDASYSPSKDGGWTAKITVACNGRCAAMFEGSKPTFRGACIADRIKDLMLNPEPKISGQCLRDTNK